MIDKALEYRRLGWPVIPLCVPTDRAKCLYHGDCADAGKKAMVKWAEINTITEEDIKSWWGKWPEANIGLLTGTRSGVFVIDIDGEKAKESIIGKKWDATVTAITGRKGGFHYYFKMGDYKVPSKSNILPGIDSRGDGGYAVLPPSIHWSKNKYRWADWGNPFESPVMEPMSWVKEIFESPQTKPSESFQKVDDRYSKTIRGQGEGHRDEDLFNLGGYFFSKGLPPTVIYEVMQLVDAQNNPPLGSKIVEQKFNQCLKYHKERKSQIPEKVVTPVSEMLTSVLPSTDWLITDLWTDQSVGFISGLPKHGRHGSPLTWRYPYPPEPSVSTTLCVRFPARYAILRKKAKRPT